MMTRHWKHMMATMAMAALVAACNQSTPFSPGSLGGGPDTFGSSAALDDGGDMLSRSWSVQTGNGAPSARREWHGRPGDVSVAQPRS